ASLPPKDPANSCATSGWQPLRAMRFSKTRFGTSILFQQPLVLIDNQTIAIARGHLQAGAIDDFDVASRIADQSCLLEHACRNRYSRAMNTEHLAQKFLGQRKAIAGDAVMSMQEPACAAFLYFVQAIARGGLRDLVHHCHHISHQQAMENWRRAQTFEKI